MLEASGGAEAIAADTGADWLLPARSALRAAAGDAHGALADQLEYRAAPGRAARSDPSTAGSGSLGCCHATGDEAAAAREAEAALAWARVWDTPGTSGRR